MNLASVLFSKHKAEMIGYCSSKYPWFDVTESEQKAQGLGVLLDKMKTMTT